MTGTRTHASIVTALVLAALAAALPRAEAARTGPGAPGSTLCEKEISAQAVATILTGPAPLNRYAMNAALGDEASGCEWGDQNAMIDYSVRTKPPLQGNNKQVYQMEISIAVPKGKPLAGVGDQAMWFDVHPSNVPGMQMLGVTAIKGDALCHADVHFRDGPQGDKALTPTRGEALARKLGALCNKSFAARGA